jgi:hypothetical protein
MLSKLAKPAAKLDTMVALVMGKKEVRESCY